MSSQWKSISPQVKLLGSISVITTSICAILLIAIAATPSYYHMKVGSIETQSGAWQYCVKSSSMPISRAILSRRMSTSSRRMNPLQQFPICNQYTGVDYTYCIERCQAYPSLCSGGGAAGASATGCSTQDVSDADTDTKNTVQSIRAFLVLGMLLSFAVIALPIIAMFIPSYGSLMCLLGGALSIVAGFCLLISWAIVAGKKADGMDLFWGFGLQVVITVALWVVGGMLGMAGMNMKGNQVTRNVAKHQDKQGGTPASTNKNVNNELASAWQQTPKAPQQQQQQQQQYP